MLIYHDHNSIWSIKRLRNLNKDMIIKALKREVEEVINKKKNSCVHCSFCKTEWYKSCERFAFIWSISNTFIRTGSILWLICRNLIVASGSFWLSLACLLITQSEVNDQLNVWILAMQQKHPTSVIQLENGCSVGEWGEEGEQRDKRRSGGRKLWQTTRRDGQTLSHLVWQS